MSQVDQKRAFNKLKHDLEPWRNLIVQLNSVLTWEKNYYPAAVGGGVTAFYVTLWALDLSIVTLVALAGLFALLFDYTYPSLSRFLFSPDNWGGQQEAEFEKVCGYLSQSKLTLIAWYEYLIANKERKSTVFVISTSVGLIAIAWIGAVVNNMLLMYMMTMGVMLYPGIQEKCSFATLKEKIDAAVGGRNSQARDNARKSD